MRTSNKAYCRGSTVELQKSDSLSESFYEQAFFYFLLCKPDNFELCSGSRVLSLPNVKDNVYPPQKKSFAFFRYLYRHQLDKYDWFMRIDDDAYLNSENLEIFLRKLDPNVPRMIGSAGFGRNDFDYVGMDEILDNLSKFNFYDNMIRLTAT